MIMNATTHSRVYKSPEDDAWKVEVSLGSSPSNPELHLEVVLTKNERVYDEISEVNAEQLPIPVVKMTHELVLGMLSDMQVVVSYTKANLMTQV